MKFKLWLPVSANIPALGKLTGIHFSICRRGLVSLRPSLWILRWGQGLLPPSMREWLRCQRAVLLEDSGVCPESEGEEAGSLEFRAGFPF